MRTFSELTLGLQACDALLERQMKIQAGYLGSRLIQATATRQRKTLISVNAINGWKRTLSA